MLNFFLSFTEEEMIIVYDRLGRVLVFGNEIET